MDVVEQRERCIAAIHHVAAVGLELAAQHQLLVTVTGVDRVGQFHVAGDRALEFEVRVQAPGVMRRAVAIVTPERVGYRRDRLQHRAVNQRQQVPQVAQARIVQQRRGPCAELLDHRARSIVGSNSRQLSEKLPRLNRFTPSASASCSSVEAC